MKYFLILQLLGQLHLVQLLHLDSTTSAEEQCGNPADIVMILDASSSIWPPYFDDQIDFVRKLAKSVGIGPNRVHLSALTFGHRVEPQFQFNTFASEEEVLEAVSKIPFMAGKRTFTHEALQYVRENTFTTENGVRSDVPHIAILMTDGQSSYRGKTAKQAKLLKEQGVQVFAIGIGRAVSEKELIGIASKPEAEFVHMVNSFKDLDKIKQLLVYQACDVTTSTTTTATTTTTKATTTTTTKKPTTTGIPEELRKACSGKPAEIVFVLDKSSSIGFNDFQKQLKFVSDVSGIFDIGPTASRIGVASFSDAENIKIEMKLDEYNDIGDIRNAIREIIFSGGGTDTAEALSVTTREMFSIRKGARSNAAYIAIVITDGQSRDPVKTKAAAKNAHSRGVHLFAIGVGDEVDLTELKDIASNPNNEYMFTVANYDALASIKNKLASKTCEVEPKKQKDIEVCGSGTLEADIMFALDTANVGGNEVRMELDLIKNLSSTFDVDSGKIQVGLLMSCPNVSDITLKESQTTREFAESLKRFSSGGVSALINRTRSEGFIAVNGGRETAKKYGILFINGNLDYNNARTEAMRAQFADIEIFTVAVGSHINKAQLDKIAASPPSEHVFHVDKIHELKLIEEKIREKICRDLQLTEMNQNSPR